MFYYLLFNSSLFSSENRLFVSILYGSILYIITHAILNYCNIELLTIINNYFWAAFALDIISLCYGVYQKYFILDESDNNVSFNLLKNKINTQLDTFLNTQQNLTITPQSAPEPIHMQSQPRKTMSTPINLIRTQLSDANIEPIITDNESVAGSDIGSLNDLEDFEKTL